MKQQQQQKQQQRQQEEDDDYDENQTTNDDDDYHHDDTISGTSIRIRDAPLSSSSSSLSLSSRRQQQRQIEEQHQHEQRQNNFGSSSRTGSSSSSNNSSSSRSIRGRSNNGRESQHHRDGHGTGSGTSSGTSSGCFSPLFFGGIILGMIMTRFGIQSEKFLMESLQYIDEDITTTTTTMSTTTTTVSTVTKNTTTTNTTDDDWSITRTTTDTTTDTSSSTPSSSSAFHHGYFILHPGPFKTGTTFIQQKSKLYETSSLRQDQYAYIGKASITFPHPIHNSIKDWQCRIQMLGARRRAGIADDDNNIYLDQVNYPSCFYHLPNNISALLNEGPYHNIFLSSESVIVIEDVPGWYWNMFHHVCNQLGLKLIVIIAYRRLYQWLPSAYTQTHSGGRSNRHFRTWPTPNKTYVRASNDGKPIIPLFPTILQSWYIDLTDGIHLWFPWTPTYIDKITIHNTNDIQIKLFNMHDPYSKYNTTLAKFFCEIMPNTYHTCQVAKQLEIQTTTTTSSTTDSTTTNAIPSSSSSSTTTSIAKTKEFISNPSQPICYDELGIAAVQHGYIDPTIYTNRRLVWEDIEKYHIKTFLNGDSTSSTRCHANSGFPLLCPSKQQLETFLNASLYWERYFFPQLYNQLQQEHIDSFWYDATTKKKFCNIDTNRTLQMNEWKTYFQDMYNNNTTFSNI